MILFLWVVIFGFLFSYYIDSILLYSILMYYIVVIDVDFMFYGENVECCSDCPAAIYFIMCSVFVE